MLRPRPEPRLSVVASLLWIIRHRAWTGYHLVRYARFVRLRLLHPEVRVEGLVFLGRGVELSARPGHGRIVLGAFSHVGDHSRLRAHEGTLRVGAKTVLGRDVTVNCYLDIDIGASTLVADSVYICDFDHRFDDLTAPIKDQGIVKSPVHIGGDCWLGTKVVVLRGTTIDFSPMRRTFRLTDAGATYEIDLTKLKALFFVRDFEGNDLETT